MMFWNIGLTRQNDRRILLVIGVVLSAMLLPAFAVSSSLPQIRLDDVLLFGIYAINLLAFALKGFRVEDNFQQDRQQPNNALKVARRIFALLTISIILSNLYAVVLLHGSFGFRDIMEFVTLAKYYLAITLVISLRLGAPEFAKLKWSFLAGFAFVVLLAWGQHINFANMNYWLSPFFDKQHWKLLIVGNPARVQTGFDNPNVTGTFAVVALTLFTTRYYFSRDNLKTSALVAVLLAFTIKLVFLTISRTALLSTGVVLTYLSVLAMFKFRWQKQILVKVGVLFLITLALFLTSPRSFTSRMNEGIHFDTSTSAQGHVKRWGSALEMIKQSPVLGWGTQKSSMTTIVDNEYELVARRYGIIGLAIYLWLFISPWFMAIKRTMWFTVTDSLTVIEPKNLLPIAYSAATLVVFFYNITGGTFYNLQLMTLFSVFMGFIYNFERKPE